ERAEALDTHVSALRHTMKTARESGEQFRQRWCALQPHDPESTYERWSLMEQALPNQWDALAQDSRPPRVAHALQAAAALGRVNRELERHMRPFVIRHRHDRRYRE